MNTRARRGFSLVEVLVVLLVVSFWMALTLEEAGNGQSFEKEELCRAGRVRLRQTLDLYRSEHGATFERIDQELIDEALLARGYLSARPRCPDAGPDELPFGLAPDGTVSCALHPERAAAPAVAAARAGMPHRRFLGMVSTFGRFVDVGLRVGFCLFPLLWILRERNRQYRVKRSAYEAASSCVRTWLVENEGRTTTRRTTGSTRRPAAIEIEFPVSLITLEGASPSSRCPVCATQGGLTAVCPACATPHHDECFHYNRGCGIYGCERSP